MWPRLDDIRRPSHEEVLGICHKEGEEVGVVVCEEVMKVLPVVGGNVEVRLEIVVCARIGEKVHPKGRRRVVKV